MDEDKTTVKVLVHLKSGLGASKVDSESNQLALIKISYNNEKWFGWYGIESWSII